LCRPASNSRRTRAANSGSACSTSRHATIAAVCARRSHNVTGNVGMAAETRGRGAHGMRLSTWPSQSIVIVS
jgi:hypothetical protein